MTRLLGFIVHNWPLKVAAIVLASLLYGVLVLARDAQQIPVTVRIDDRGLPDNSILLSPLGQVSRVRYIAQPDVLVNSESFIAWVDLSSVTPGEGTRLVNVQVEAGDSRIRPLEWEPRQIRVTVDRIESKRVPIVVDQGQVPEQLDVRRPEIDPGTAVARGAASAVEQVDRVVASVSINPAGIDVDRDVELVPVDRVGAAVQEVDVEPSTARVRIAVISDSQTKPVPVSPDIVGEPAPGFEIATVTVEPLTVTVEGDGDQLANLVQVVTEPISLNGASATVERTASLELPAGVLPIGASDVNVVVTLRPVTGTRTLNVGIRLEGALPDRPYDVSVREFVATLGGSVADLARFDSATFQLEVQVTGLGPGRHEMEVTADLPAGLALLSVSPPTVIVTVGQPATPPVPATPTASPAP